MEEIKLENEIKLCDVKKENIRKTMEKIKSQASDVLILNLQWCDLEDYLKSAGEKVEKRYRELESKEVELENRSFALEQRVKVVEAAESEIGDLEMKANGFRRDIEEKREELGVLRQSLKECNVEHMSKTGQLNELVELLRKTQVDIDMQGGKLSRMVTDLERYRVKVNAEKEHLGRTENDRRELEVELERKRKALTLVLDNIAECDKLFETRSSELIKTLGEVELKGEQLQQMNIDLERYRVEVSAEKELLGRDQTHRKALQEEIERKTKDLKLVVDKIAKCEKLFETQSSELIKKQGEVELKGKKLEQMNIDLQRHCGEVSAEMEHLDRSQTRNRKLEEEIERKKEDLTVVLEKIAEYGKQLEAVEEQLASQQKLLETRSLELVSKKKELDELSLELDQANSLNNEMKVICQQIKSKGKDLEEIERLIQERTGHNESIKLLLEKHSEELASKERHNEKISSEIVSKEKTIQQLSEKQHSKQKKMDLTEKHLKKSTAEFVLKDKELCSVKDAYRECLQNWEMKEKELKSLQEEVKKIQDSLKGFQSKEAEQVKLKASFMEREKELEMKEKQVRAHSEKIELKEKNLGAREERIDKKDEQLKSTEQKLAKCVKDYELKAETLASFCQQNPDQQVDLVRDASVCDEKTLQLLLHGHLEKRHQLHLDVLRSLKASSDPAKLVLVTIQELHERMAVTKREPDSVRRSSICLLECLMDMSPKPKTDVQGEAIRSATEWKNTTVVKAGNPVAVLGFLHFLAAFSLAYTFDDDKVQNLFDAAFLCQYAPSLCEALGLSSVAPVNIVLSSLDDKPEQQPCEAPIRNSSDSRYTDVQENIASSHSGHEDALLDPEGSASFSPNEVFTGLQVMTDPASYVLNLVNDELVGAQQRGELDLTEPIAKNLVSLLEELPRVVRSSKHLLSDAIQVANRWSRMMGNSAQMSPLEAWGFLQLIVAYELVHRTDRDNTLRFALHVAHFKQAPKLFDSLGLRYAIPDLVRQFLDERHYFQAIRFIFYFNLKCNFSPLEFLKEEIINLRRSPKDKRRFDSQAKDRDGAKLRNIIELIEDFKLEIGLPVELIVKFMVPREIENQNQYVVSPFIPDQPPQVHMQASQTVIHSSYITTHGSNPSFPTSLGGSPNQQVLDTETYQAGCSTVFHGKSLHQAGFKRPRMDPSVPRRCFNPSSYGRF